MELDPDQSLAIIVVVQPNQGTVLHLHAAAAELAVQTLASMSCGDSAGIKCNTPKYYEILVLYDLDQLFFLLLKTNLI